jgi:hypothetical protein
LGRRFWGWVVVLLLLLLPWCVSLRDRVVEEELDCKGLGRAMSKSVWLYGRAAAA